MSTNPFTADDGRRRRIGEIMAAIGTQVSAEIGALIAQHQKQTSANMGAVIAADAAAALIDRFELDDVRILMLLCLDAATKLARPPISDFFVGAVGLEAETRNLVLGGNVEFPGAHLGLTVHGEGFVFTRAFSRGTTISVIALGEAHPCAHCRQYLSEFGASRELQLIDLLGHTLTLADLYPWPFDPAYLGQSGVDPTTLNFPHLAFSEEQPRSDALDQLLQTGTTRVRALQQMPVRRCPRTQRRAAGGRRHD